MLARAVLLLASVATLASCQIDPNNVPLATRDAWCLQQQESCPLLCLQIPGATDQPEANSCDPKTLGYSCVCSNGIQPNASQYSQTIPYFICTEQNNECVSACNGDSVCQSACRDDHPCGAQHPIRVNKTTSTASAASGGMSATASASNVVYTGFGSGAAATGAPKSGTASRGWALEFGQMYGTAALIGGVFAGFAVLL